MAEFWGVIGTIAAVGIGLIIVFVIVEFLIASAFMLLAAKIVKVENATFGRAMLATFLGGLASGATFFVLGLLFAPLFIAGTALSAIGAYLVDSLVVKAIFGTSYGKGLLTNPFGRGPGCGRSNHYSTDCSGCSGD